MTEDQEIAIRARKKHLERLWAPGRWTRGVDCSEVEKFIEFIVSELEILGADVSLKWRVAEHARQWRKDRNPAHIGYAISLCAISAVEPGPTLSAEAAEILRRQALGGLDTGSMAKLPREEAKRWAFWLMCNLKLAGASSVEEAASKAAFALYQRTGGKLSFKASSLSRTYNNEYLNAAGDDGNAEERQMKLWQQRPGIEQEWKALLASMPDAHDDLLGARR